MRRSGDRVEQQDKRTLQIKTENRGGRGLPIQGQKVPGAVYGCRDHGNIRLTLTQNIDDGNAFSFPNKVKEFLSVAFPWGARA